MIAKINMTFSLSADNIAVSVPLYTAATRWIEAMALPPVCKGTLLSSEPSRCLTDLS